MKRVPLTVLIIAICTVLVLGLRIMLNPLVETRYQPECFKELLKEVTEGQLKPQPNGVITIPARFSSCTKNGKAYIAKPSDGGIWIFFPSYIFHGELRGYIVSNEPIHIQKELQPSNGVEVLYFPKTAISPQVFTVGRKINPTCYYVYANTIH